MVRNVEASIYVGGKFNDFLATEIHQIQLVSLFFIPDPGEKLQGFGTVGEASMNHHLKQTYFLLPTWPCDRLN